MTKQENLIDNYFRGALSCRDYSLFLELLSDDHQFRVKVFLMALIIKEIKRKYIENKKNNSLPFTNHWYYILQTMIKL
jgi:hypothetical protein